MNRALSASLALLAAFGCGPAQLDPDDASSEAGSETASSTETSSADTSNDSPTTANAIPQDDAMPDDCDPYQQDCPDGEKCVPYRPDGGAEIENKCVPIMGEGEPGDPCWSGGLVEGTDNCGEGNICWNVSEVEGELLGTCHALCSGSVDNLECPAGSSCATGADSSLAVCMVSCDPFGQDCSNDYGCYWTGLEFQCVTTTSNLPTGSACGYINDCATGHLCMPTETLPSCQAASCCTLFCNLELGDQQCAAVPGSSCVPFFEAGRVPPDYQHVGVCLSP